MGFGEKGVGFLIVGWSETGEGASRRGAGGPVGKSLRVESRATGGDEQRDLTGADGEERDRRVKLSSSEPSNAKLRRRMKGSGEERSQPRVRWEGEGAAAVVFAAEI